METREFNKINRKKNIDEKYSIYASGVIGVFTILIIATNSVTNYPSNPPLTYLWLIIVVILYVSSLYYIGKKKREVQTSPEEDLFFLVYPTFNDLKVYLDEGKLQDQRKSLINKTRFFVRNLEAKYKIGKKTLEKRELGEHIKTFKTSFNDRIFPIVIKGNEEELRSTIGVFQNMLNFFRNPTIENLIGLNKDIQKIESKYPPEPGKFDLIKTLANTLWSRSTIQHFTFASIAGISMLLITSYIYHLTSEASLTLAVAIFGTIFLYFAQIKKE